MELTYGKPLNAAKDPDHAPLVRRIIRCPLPIRADGPACRRTILEYADLHLPETRHRPGSLPETVIDTALEAGARLVEMACDHHGGEQYKPPNLNV